MERVIGTLVLVVGLGIGAIAGWQVMRPEEEAAAPTVTTIAPAVADPIVATPTPPTAADVKVVELRE